MDKRGFMDFMVDDFFKPKEFNVNDFINSLGNIKQMKTFELLDRISSLKLDDRKKIFTIQVVKNRLKEVLLLESGFSQWYYYREILKRITAVEFLSLYSVNELKEFFSRNDCGHISVFFSALCESDVNGIVRYVLKDNEMFEYFLEYSEAYSYDELDYDLVKNIILKIQKEHLSFNDDFLANLSLEYQKELIKETEINDNSLVYLLSSFRNSVNSYFFMNDNRSFYLYNRFNIVNLVKSGVKFNDNILKKRDFFDKLKSSSFIEFRNNINAVEKNNNPIIIEDRLEEYYDELINLYDMQSGLFKEYKNVLDNPKKQEFDNNFIFDFDVVCKISNHLKQDGNKKYYYENREGLEIFLKNETSKKLSEVIIDALFRDNIYNVWININEMLRYNDKLDDKDKVLNSDKVAFYQMILSFDSISNGDKINLYNKYKKNNFSLVFYEDLRSVKDKAYHNIKNKLLNPTVHPEYIDKENTDKYGVPVYDLRDKEYTMLVRTQAEFREVDRYRRGCYCVISNEKTQVFGENDYDSFLYGYNSFDNDMVLHMFESDSFSSNIMDEGSRRINRIMSVDELVKSNNSYNEVQLINVKSDKGKYKWTAKRPDFIVAFDYINERHINESKRLSIPIVIISKKKLDKNDVIYDIEPDEYVYNLYSEHEHRVKR